MRYRNIALCGASCAVMSAFASPVWAQAAATPAGAPAVGGGPSTVSEIVVTAQKRQESVNRVPMSIQAATGQQLTRLGITDTGQLAKIVPGLNFTPAAYGTPVYTIRGVGFQDTSLAASPTVSVYLDEAPLPYSIMTQGASLDLERVEVLKGPQGTLFGSNATGGAINYIAAKPTDHFTAGVDASYGRFNRADISGFVSGPITDTLSFRAAARLLEGGPWQTSYTHNAEAGSPDFLNGRISLQWKPTSNFKALLTLNGWRDRSESQMAQLYGIVRLNPNTPIDPRIAAYPLAPHDDRSADWGACVNTSPFDPPFNQIPAPYGFNPPRPLNSTDCTGFRANNSYFGGSLRMDWELGNDITLTSLTSYQTFSRNQPIEGDGIIYQDYESLQRGHINTVYQELRLAGNWGGKGSWLAGVNFEHDGTFDQFLQTYGGSSSTPLSFPDGNTIRLGPARPVNSQQTNTYAVFGNVEYPVLENLNVQAGLRFTETDKKFWGCGTDSGDGTWAASSKEIQDLLELQAGYITQAQYLAGQGHGVDVGPGGCGTTGPGPTFNPSDFHDTLNQSNISWRAGLNYTGIKGSILYFNVSQGFKAGSFPTVATSSYTQLRPVTQEKLLAYEAGFKSQLLDRTLQLNGAVFYYDYKNKQILGDLTDPVFGALPALVNVPKSHVVGFELNGVWTPFHGLTVTPGLSYSKSKIDGDYFNYDAFGQPSNLGGEPFPSAPTWQASLDVNYTWALNDKLDAFVGGNLNYQSETHAGFYSQDPASLVPQDILRIPARTLLDLRAGVEQGPWRFQVWGRNITDKWYWNGAYHVNDVLIRYTGMPRTYGVTVSYRFQ